MTGMQPPTPPNATISETLCVDGVSPAATRQKRCEKASAKYLRVARRAECRAAEALSLVTDRPGRDGALDTVSVPRRVVLVMRQPSRVAHRVCLLLADVDVPEGPALLAILAVGLLLP